MTNFIHTLVLCNWMQLFYLEHAKTDRALGPIKERLCPRIQAWSDAQAREALGWVERNGGFDGHEVIYLNCIIMSTCVCLFKRNVDHISLCNAFILTHLCILRLKLKIMMLGKFYLMDQKEAMLRR